MINITFKRVVQSNFINTSDINIDLFKKMKYEFDKCEVNISSYDIVFLIPEKVLSKLLHENELIFFGHHKDYVKEIIGINFEEIKIIIQFILFIKQTKKDLLNI